MVSVGVTVDEALSEHLVSNAPLYFLSLYLNASRYLSVSLCRALYFELCMTLFSLSLSNVIYVLMI